MKLRLLPVTALLLLGAAKLAIADVYTCIGGLDADTSLWPIRGKVALSSSASQPFSMLADSTTPSKEEAQSLLDWGSKREQCVKANPFPSNNPYRQHVIEGFNATQSILIELYNGRITYGQFARQRQEIARIVEARTQQMTDQYQQQQYQQQQYQQQRADYQYQACLNRARNQLDQANCGIAAGAAGIAGALVR